MKLFSTKKAVSIQDGNVIIEDLAYNHPYKKENNMLVVKGKDGDYSYKSFYSLKGDFLYIRLEKESHSHVLACFRKDVDLFEVIKIKNNGDTFSVLKKYETTQLYEKKLVETSFSLTVDGREECQTFGLSKQGFEKISPQMRMAWLQN